MKGWLKLLVLGAVPILAVTMVADQTLAADKGSQLIFRTNMAHVNFISIVNANPHADGRAVTVLVQYYNDSGKATSSHFLIAITAVGANMDGVPAGTDATDVATGEAVANTAATANVLFPDYLAADLDGTDNIDNGGVITSSVPEIPDPVPDDESIVNHNLMLTEFTAPDDNPDADDNTSKNVGELAIGNAEPISFNYLTGHFTEALVGGSSGSDQTAAWGGAHR